MNIYIKQIQDEELLKEHAKSSYNYYFFSKYEFIIYFIVFIIGFLIVCFTSAFWLAGSFMILIGIFEMAKYPFRVSRWVKKKKKEKLFGKLFNYYINDKGLRIIVDEIDIFRFYSQMRACLISKTGILFKVTYLEYFYISFSSFLNKKIKEEVICFLEKEFNIKRK